MEVAIFFTNGEFINMPQVDKFSIDGGNIKIRYTKETPVRKIDINSVFALDKIAGYEIIRETKLDEDEEYHNIEDWCNDPDDSPERFEK